MKFRRTLLSPSTGIKTVNALTISDVKCPSLVSSSERNMEFLRHLKLSPWSEWLILVFWLLPSVLCLFDDVSEHLICSIFWVDPEDRTGKVLKTRINHEISWLTQRRLWSMLSLTRIRWRVWEVHQLAEFERKEFTAPTSCSTAKHRMEVSDFNKGFSFTIKPYAVIWCL
jgi:hypothetical protein